MLYVEDEDAAFLLFKTALQTADIQVQLHRAADGEAALDFLNQTRPDLVVLDLNLPRKNGFDVLAEMRHTDGLETISVVVFTSSARQIDKHESLALGAQGYITKPFTYDGFVEAVRIACSYLPAET